MHWNLIAYDKNNCVMHLDFGAYVNYSCAMYYDCYALLRLIIVV